MASDSRDRFEGQDAESVFRDFLRSASAPARADDAPGPADGDLTPVDGTALPEGVTMESPDDPPAGDDAPDEDSPTFGKVVLLTHRKSERPPGDTTQRMVAPGSVSAAAPRPERSSLLTVDERDQALEASLVVPDVAAVEPPSPPPRERSEDGLIPAGELDRLLGDMTVLLRYGHVQEVRRHLIDLCQRYPEDLLLLRRISEFHLETGDTEGAMEALFTLAGRLFERRNVLGMRRALEQVLVLDPTHKRAYRLLGLLDERPSTGTGG